MKKISFLLIFFQSFNLLAQSQSTIAFSSDEKLNIEVNQLDPIKISNVEIKGFELDFQYKPRIIRIDNSNLSLIILSNSRIPNYNLLFCYSLLGKNVKWQLITQANNFELYDSLIYLGAFDKEFMIDSRTGRILWQKDTHSYHIGLKEKDILISLKGISDVEILQASSGKILWSKKTNKIHGINDFNFINDTTMLLALDGLYCINLSTGREDHVEMKTSQRSTSGFLGGNFLLSGKTSMLSWYPYGIILFGLNGLSGMSSNLLKLDNAVYIADNKSLYSLKPNDLSNNWTTSFNGLKLGISRLYDTGSNISLLNLGLARHSGLYRKYGRPFFAIFDKKIGSIKKVIYINKSETFRQFQEYKNEILLLSKSHLLKFNNQGDLLDSLYFTEEDLYIKGELRGIVKTDEFKSKLYHVGSTKINKLDSINYIAITDKGFLLFKRNLNDYSINDFKTVGSAIYENDKIQLIAGIEINKGIIFRRVLDLIYVVDKYNGTILGSFKFRSVFNKQNYIVGEVNKKVQVYMIQEN